MPSLDAHGFPTHLSLLTLTSHLALHSIYLCASLLVLWIIPYRVPSFHMYYVHIHGNKPTPILTHTPPTYTQPYTYRQPYTHNPTHTHTCIHTYHIYTHTTLHINLHTIPPYTHNYTYTHTYHTCTPTYTYTHTTLHRHTILCIVPLSNYHFLTILAREPQSPLSCLPHILSHEPVNCLHITPVPAITGPHWPSSSMKVEASASNSL